MLYMAPERFKQGFSSSVASDVYSLGMIYFELLAGKLPFSQEMHPMHYIVSGQYLKDVEHCMNTMAIPKSIRKLIVRMIAHNSSERISNYSELREEMIKAWRNSNSFFGKLFK